MSTETKKYPSNPILPVIHLQHGSALAVSMAEKAIEAGAGGVFVIDHRPGTFKNEGILAEAVTDVITEFPELWVGVNCLGLTAIKSIEFFGKETGVDAVWVDNALDWQSRMSVRQDHRHMEEEGSALRSVKKGNAVVFGGVSMKGTGYVRDDEEASRLVAHSQKYIDVVTTSGVGTGQPIEKPRLQALRDVIYQGDKLAVASGVDRDNLYWHLQLADYVLVGSSIETEPLSGIFDKNKLASLMSAYLEFELDNLAGIKKS